jgi:aerobic carbon-monoxide dehydrogenase medium subunit
MIRGAFEYHAPTSADEAAELVPTLEGETAVISGGTWVVPEMTHGVRRPKHVVDLRRAGLEKVARENGSLVIGTTATYADVLEAGAAAGFDALQTMVVGVTGGAQIHNQATLGGSACYANPGSDVPGLLVGVHATLRLARGDSRREVPAADFFQGAFRTALEPGELLTALALPVSPAGARSGYYKFKLSESSWPIATGCCVTDAGGAVTTLALGGVSPAPVVVAAAVGATDADAVAAAVGDTEFEPWSDALADGSYRKKIAHVVARRAYLAAAG